MRELGPDSLAVIVVSRQLPKLRQHLRVVILVSSDMVDLNDLYQARNNVLLLDHHIDIAAITDRREVQYQPE